MCNICDYCDDNGRVVPFVGEAYVCPKCNGTKVLPVAAETVKNSIGMDIPMPQDAGVDGQTDIRWLDGVIRGEILTPEQIEIRHRRPIHWHQAPAADANARPKFEIQDETSIICGHVVPGRSAVEGHRAAINWLEHGHGGKVYADTETQPLSGQGPYQKEDRVHRANIQHISPQQAQMMANAANQKKLSVWYDSKLDVSYNGASNQDPPDILFEKTLDPNDVFLRVWQEPGAVPETYKILRMVNEAIEEGRISNEHGYQIAQLPMRSQEEALNGSVQLPGRKTFFSSCSRQMGKSSEWRRYRENFLAQWQSAEAGQNYIDAMAYSSGYAKEINDQYKADEKAKLFGVFYGSKKELSSMERQFQTAMAEAPTLGEIISLMRVTEGRLSSDAAYFQDAHGGSEEQTKMLNKVRRMRTKLQNVEKCLMGRIHQNHRLAELLKPRDVVPHPFERMNLERKSMSGDDVARYLALRKMNGEQVSVEVTTEQELPKRGDLSEMKPVIVDIKIDNIDVKALMADKARIIRRVFEDNLKGGMVLDQSDVGRVIREKDELDEEHAKGTGPMPPKELL